ncbi:MAG: DUF1127 domain-containing protein [Pseudomonadota bacterium]
MAAVISSTRTGLIRDVVLGWIDEVYRTLEQAHRAALIRAELDAYTDRDLDDLGISRADIPAIASGEYQRD